MFKKFTTAAITAALVLCTSLTAFAYGWTYDTTIQRWWCGANEDNSVKCVSGWYLVDGDRDGNAQWYLLDDAGMLYTSCVTPDGYTVNRDGAWTVNGEVQYVVVGDTDPVYLMWFGTYEADDGQIIHVSDVDGGGVDITFYGYGEAGEYAEDDRLSFTDIDGYVAVAPVVNMDGDVIGEDTYTLSEDGSKITVNSQSFKYGEYYRQW